MAKVYLSYRRKDSSVFAERIYDRLVSRFGTDAVFKDIDSIPLGVDFRHHLNDAIGKCDVFLAIIGTNWLNVADQDGRRRLEDPLDFVRVELDAALQRQIPVIPVLVNGAQLPREEDLPPSLQPLVYRHATEINSGRDFQLHMERLIQGIDTLFKSPASREKPRLPTHYEVLDDTATGQPVPRPRVFISHSSADRDVVERCIIRPLQENGIETCSAPLGQLTSSQQWERRILQDMESCDWFLVAISRNSASSTWVQAELSWAFAKRSDRIVPVLLDDCDWRGLHLMLGRIHLINFHIDQDEGLRQLVAIWKVDQIANLYVVGRPVKGNLFVGRRDILKVVEDNLSHSAGNNILVLRGQRRTGKTSVLLRLQETLAISSNGTYVPVFIDLQGMVRTRNEGEFFYALAHHIWRDLRKHGVQVSKPVQTEYEFAPTTTFELSFLEQATEMLGERRILLMFDEFEKIKELIDRGCLSESVLDYFRHLMQHSPLLFLIAGTQKLRDLTGGYWSVFFNLALPIDIGALQETDARWLVTEPIRPWYHIQPDGVGEIIRAAGCHPYFTQLVCHTLLNVRNEGRFREMTLSHVLDALERALQSGDEQIGYPWTEEDCTPDERLILCSMARKGGNPVGLSTIHEEIENAGLAIAFGPAISRLQVRGVIKQTYNYELTFTVPLFQKWLVRKGYDDLESVRDYNRDRQATRTQLHNDS